MTVELVFHFQGSHIEGCDLSGHQAIEEHPSGSHAVLRMDTDCTGAGIVRKVSLDWWS